MNLVLGIDPGSVVTGYGLVAEEGGRLVCISYGVFSGGLKKSFAQRLLSIGEGLREVLEKYKPTSVAVEKTFHAKNVDSVTKLSHARGVCIYEVARAQLPVFEYLPTEVKGSVAGNGRADKAQVQFVVRGLLGLSAMEKFDMSDALAVAIHHVRLSTTQEKMKAREVTNDRLP
jgi:crossover junction endodeoxyribonuclease RuvC